MRLPDDAARLKRLLADPQRVLAALSLLDGAKRQGGGFYILCPWHAENTPSCFVREGRDGTLGLKCFGCGTGGDVFHLIAQVHRLVLPGDFPRVVTEGWKILGESAAEPPQPRRAAPPRRLPPPVVEVERLWAGCAPMSDDADLSRQLVTRRIDPKVVTARDLARALRTQGPLPGWARGESRWWREGNRCILPLYNPAGDFVSLHARAVAPAQEHSKGLLPAGHSAAGLFFADGPALAILRQGITTRSPRSSPLRLMIAEGGIDFLTLACCYGDTDDRPAIFGILAGSWSSELAQRIPSGCHVAIKTHRDTAGRRYRDRIADSIGSRCRVFVDADEGQAHA